MLAFRAHYSWTNFFLLFSAPPITHVKDVDVYDADETASPSPSPSPAMMMMMRTAATTMTFEPVKECCPEPSTPNFQHAGNAFAGVKCVATGTGCSWPPFTPLFFISSSFFFWYFGATFAVHLMASFLL